ncbi:MAG: hypothetical protein R3246_16350, partial [Acidimicrobiia bacterium]|nr:hypothetical protein [Acidimicrobiia bacterium]
FLESTKRPGKVPYYGGTFTFGDNEPHCYTGTPDGQETFRYHLDVWARSTDSNWAVDGVITIDNPAPFTATITDVSDEISGTGPVPVDCGVTFPYDLEAFGTLECTYGSSLPDGTTRTNTATATTTGVVGSGSGMASVDFSTATIDETDETISVNDPFGGGYLGDVTAPEPQGDIDFTYTHWIVADDLDCGRNEVVNTATFTTNDTGTQGSDSWTIVVEVTCSNTCTLTQGYWKTHSDLGPAPYDDNWANLPNGAATEFFDTGHSWYEVFWTPPKGGNPFYILAHQYQAAYLNMLNGSSVPGDVAIALSEAATLLDANDSPPKINKKSSDGEDALALAGILAAYNEGLIGPGHCSE